MRSAKIGAGALIFLLGAAFPGGAAAADSGALDAIVQDFARREHFMGTVLVVRGAETALRRGYGFSSEEGGARNGSQTRYAAASITKLFTTVAVFQLREKGLLKLDDPVAAFVPGWPRRFAGVTIAHLLTHTSGLPKDAEFPRGCATERIAADLAAAKPRAAPGGRHLYSNTGFRILGGIVAKLSGRSYGDYVRSEVLAPLRMSETGFADGPQDFGPTAAGHRWRNGRWLAVAGATPCADDSAAGLWTNVDDLRRFDVGLSTGALLNADSSRAMFAAAAGRYPYGWMTGTRFGRRYEEHGGVLSGFQGYFARYPDDGVSIVVLGNVQDARADRLGERLAAALFGSSGSGGSAR